MSRPSKTGTKLRYNILLLIATSVIASKTAVKMLHPSESYVRKVLKELKDDEIIKLSRSKPQVLKFTSTGVNYLATNEKDLYEFYMKYSCNHNPACNKRHIAAYVRTSEVLAMMIRAEVKVGPQKANLIQIATNNEKKMSPTTAAFYTLKEIKYSDSQKVSRAHLSRASGILFSRGTCALVYNTQSTIMRVAAAPELESNIRIPELVRTLFDNMPFTVTKDSIVICNDDDVMLGIMRAPQQKTKTKFISDFVLSTAYTKTGFRYISFNEAGINSLNRIIKNTREDFQSACFTEQQRRNAKEINRQTGLHVEGASINHAYEFLSCNVSKLSFIKKSEADLSVVGIVVCTEQVDFVKEYFADGTHPKLRVLPVQTVQELLGEENSNGD